MIQSILLIKTDGGARGNPGPAATGIYIADNNSKKKIHSFGKYIGETTNNVAEYMAVVQALTWVKENISVLRRQYTSILLISDSNLLVNQVKGLFKIKNARLGKLVFKIKTLEQSISLIINYKHVKREFNTEPDAILNNILISKNTG